MATFGVPETLPLPPALLIRPRLLNQYYLDALIGGKSGFLIVGVLGGVINKLERPGFFEVCDFFLVVFMFKYHHRYQENH